MTEDGLLANFSSLFGRQLAISKGAALFKHGHLNNPSAFLLETGWIFNHL